MVYRLEKSRIVSLSVLQYRLPYQNAMQELGHPRYKTQYILCSLLILELEHGIVSSDFDVNCDLIIRWSIGSSEYQQSIPRVYHCRSLHSILHGQFQNVVTYQ
jgi:hypothetical protein